MRRTELLSIIAIFAIFSLSESGKGSTEVKDPKPDEKEIEKQQWIARNMSYNIRKYYSDGFNAGSIRQILSVHAKNLKWTACNVTKDYKAYQKYLEIILPKVKKMHTMIGNVEHACGINVITFEYFDIIEFKSPEVSIFNVGKVLLSMEGLSYKIYEIEEGCSRDVAQIGDYSFTP